MKLTILDELTKQRRELEFPNNESIHTIGRDPRNTLQLPISPYVVNDGIEVISAYISRFHAKLISSNIDGIERIFIEDCSTHGTKIVAPGKDPVLLSKSRDRINSENYKILLGKGQYPLLIEKIDY